MPFSCFKPSVRVVWLLQVCPCSRLRCYRPSLLLDQCRPTLVYMELRFHPTCRHTRLEQSLSGAATHFISRDRAGGEVRLCRHVVRLRQLHRQAARSTRTQQYSSRLLEQPRQRTLEQHKLSLSREQRQP